MTQNRARKNLEALFFNLYYTLDDSHYDTEDVLEAAEHLDEEYPEVRTPSVVAVSPQQLDETRNEVSDALESDREKIMQKQTLFSVLKENEVFSEVEQDINEAGYDFGYLKENFYRELRWISDRQLKRALALHRHKEDIQAASAVLNSPDFKEAYLQELVSKIRRYLNGEEVNADLKDITSELVGELSTRGWREDSFKEARKLLNPDEDQEEFFTTVSCHQIEREYCVPLPYTDIPNLPLEVGGVEFLKREDDSFTFLDPLFDSSKKAATLTNMLTEDHELFAVLKVSAATKERGQYKMENKLERAIDALNIGQKRGVIQSPFIQLQTKYICQLPDGTYHSNLTNHPKYAFPHSFRINSEEEWLDMLECFDFFQKCEEERTELENRFIRSYRWYGDALQSGIKEDELLKYIIAMESMLVPERGARKKSALAGRLADLLGIYEQYRDGFENGVLSLYEIRNEIVHNAEKNMGNVDTQIDNARQKATQMYGTIAARHIGENGDIHALLNEINDLETPTAPDNHNPFRVG